MKYASLFPLIVQFMPIPYPNELKYVDIEEKYTDIKKAHTQNKYTYGILFIDVWNDDSASLSSSCYLLPEMYRAFNIYILSTLLRLSIIATIPDPYKPIAV